MATVTMSDPKIVNIEVTDESIHAELADGRTVSVPLAWSWRLTKATPSQRKRFEIIGTGQGVHWPDIDEDISVQGMLHGTPVPPPKRAKAIKKKSEGDSRGK
jgi:hypothetical protein